MKCKFIFILLNMFLWNYGLFENAQTLLVKYVEHGVSFLNQYANYCIYEYRQWGWGHLLWMIICFARVLFFFLKMLLL